MKYCEKCGKEIMNEAVVCPNCGCAVEKKAQQETAKPNSTGLLVAGLIVLPIGIIFSLFINAWVGVVITLIAGIIFSIARTNIQKYVKSGNPSIQKDELKKSVKEFEASDTVSKACHIMAIVSIIAELIFVIIASVMGV